MRNSRQGAIPSELAWLIDTLDDYQRRLGILEAPSGESVFGTVQRLTMLVNNIQAQLDLYNAERYTNAQIDAAIDAKVAAAIATRLTQDQVDQRVQIALASYFAGNVAVGGALSVQGTVTMPGARNTSIATKPSNVIARIAGDGTVGYA